MCKEVAGVCHSEFAVRSGESDFLSHDSWLSPECKTHSVCPPTPTPVLFQFLHSFFLFLSFFVLLYFPSILCDRWRLCHCAVNLLIKVFFVTRQWRRMFPLCVCVCVCVCTSAEFITPSNRPEGVWSVLLTGVCTYRHTHTLSMLKALNPWEL